MKKARPTTNKKDPYGYWEHLRGLPDNFDGPDFLNLNDPANRPQGKCYVALDLNGCKAHCTRLVSLSISGFLAVTHHIQGGAGHDEIEIAPRLYTITHLPSGMSIFKRLGILTARTYMSEVDGAEWGCPGNKASKNKKLRAKVIEIREGMEK